MNSHDPDDSPALTITTVVSRKRVNLIREGISMVMEGYDREEEDVTDYVASD